LENEKFKFSADAEENANRLPFFVIASNFVIHPQILDIFSV